MRETGEETRPLVIDVNEFTLPVAGLSLAQFQTSVYKYKYIQNVETSDRHLSYA